MVDVAQHPSRAHPLVIVVRAGGVEEAHQVDHERLVAAFVVRRVWPALHRRMAPRWSGYRVQRRLTRRHRVLHGGQQRRLRVLVTDAEQGGQGCGGGAGVGGHAHLPGRLMPPQHRREAVRVRLWLAAPRHDPVVASEDVLVIDVLDAVDGADAVEQRGDVRQDRLAQHQLGGAGGDHARHHDVDAVLDERARGDGLGFLQNIQVHLRREHKQLRGRTHVDLGKLLHVLQQVPAAGARFQGEPKVEVDQQGRNVLVAFCQMRRLSRLDGAGVNLHELVLIVAADVERPGRARETRVSELCPLLDLVTQQKQLEGGDRGHR